jgi:CBS domain-containing protein
MGSVLTRARVVSAESPVADLVTRPPVVVSPAATVAEVAAAMRAAAVSAALVDEGGRLVHERDLAGAFADGVDGAATVGNLALAAAVVVPGKLPIVTAAGVMLNERTDHLVVEMSDGGFALVSMTDVTAVLLQAVDPHLWLTSLRVAIEAPAEIWLG